MGACNIACFLKKTKNTSVIYGSLCGCDLMSDRDVGNYLPPGNSTTPDTAIMQKRAETVLPLVVPMQKRRTINCLS